MMPQKIQELICQVSMNPKGPGARCRSKTGILIKVKKSWLKRKAKMECRILPMTKGRKRKFAEPVKLATWAKADSPPHPKTPASSPIVRLRLEKESMIERQPKVASKVPFTNAETSWPLTKPPDSP